MKNICVSLSKIILIFIICFTSNSLKSQKSSYSYFDSIPDIPILGLNKLDSIVNNYTVFLQAKIIVTPIKIQILSLKY